MTVELDHMFVFTGVGAPEADRLVAFGLTEGTSNPHPGQGTANRRFFFRNAVLELPWVHDECEARSPSIAPARLWERWKYRFTGYSPFGICLRSSTPTGTALPLAMWEYRPPYLPPGLHVDVAGGTAASEPLLFSGPYGGRPDAFPK